MLSFGVFDVVLNAVVLEGVVVVVVVIIVFLLLWQLSFDSLLLL